MASVERVYKTLKDLVNKDQRGFITPAVFNQFASVAQMNVYNRLFDRMTRSSRMGQRPASSKESLEDLSTFTKQATLTLSSGITDKPSDFARAVTINTITNVILGVSQSNLVQIVYNTDHIDRIINSDIMAPSDDAPVALISDKIEVFPNTGTNITSIVLRYYKLPQGINPTTQAKTTAQPSFGYTSAVTGVELYSAANSVDFELPEMYFTDLIDEVAELIGVSLRDKDVFSYASSENEKTSIS
tara:strand:- start:2304 stop:3035 length:732 start_codon:yes stop_codon:yes gene_type:complete